MVMAAPLAVTAPSRVQNLMNSSSRRSMVSRGVLMIETNYQHDVTVNQVGHNHYLVLKVPISGKKHEWYQ